MQMGADKSIEKVYQFGKNWKRFLESGFTKERVDIAQKHILEFLRLDDLHGRTFVDVGCGSGIHSLAALCAGAEKVISFDVDTDSVEAAMNLRESVGNPEQWVITHGSVLDAEFMGSLEKGDIVYSWGVLHHTGDMWKAIEHSSIPLKENGVLYIALYSTEVYQNPSPEYWIDLKQKYNMATAEEKEEMELTYAWDDVLKSVALKGDNPFIYIRDYKKSRGMEFWTDVRDWLGGYPMEFTTAGEFSHFMADQSGLDVINIKTGEGNTEFLLRSKHCKNYWDDIFKETKSIVLNSDEIKHQNGFCYVADFPELASFADTNGQHFRSPLMLFEDNILVGFPHAKHDYIKEKGGGSYCHWENMLIFSTSDNSNPVDNGREYSIRLPK